MNDLADIVEDEILKALERCVCFARPLRVALSWPELARLHGPFGSRFRVLQRNGDPTSGFEIQFVAEDLDAPRPLPPDDRGAPFWVTLQ